MIPSTSSTTTEIITTTIKTAAGESTSEAVKSVTPSTISEVLNSTTEVVQNTVDSLKTTLKEVFTSSTEAIATNVVNAGTENSNSSINLLETATTNILDDGDIKEMVTSNITSLETNSTVSAMIETSTNIISNLEKGIDWLGQTENSNSTSPHTNDTFLNSNDKYHDNNPYLPIYIMLGSMLVIMCIVCLILGITYYIYKKKNRLHSHGEYNFGASYSQTLQTKDC